MSKKLLKIAGITVGTLCIAGVIQYFIDLKNESELELDLGNADIPDEDYELLDEDISKEFDEFERATEVKTKLVEELKKLIIDKNSAFYDPREKNKELIEKYSIPLPQMEKLVNYIETNGIGKFESEISKMAWNKETASKIASMMMCEYVYFVIDKLITNDEFGKVNIMENGIDFEKAGKKLNEKIKDFKKYLKDFDSKYGHIETDEEKTLDDVVETTGESSRFSNPDDLDKAIEEGKKESENLTSEEADTIINEYIKRKKDEYHSKLNKEKEKFKYASSDIQDAVNKEAEIASRYIDRAIAEFKKAVAKHIKEKESK